MSFLIYFAVLIVAAAGALFGLDLATAPLPPQKPVTQVSANAPNKLARHNAEQRDSKQGDATRELTPIYPTNPAAGKDVRMVYPPTTDTAAAPPAKEPASAAMAKTDAPAQPAAQAPVPTATAPVAQPAAPVPTASAVPAPAAAPPEPQPQPTIQPAMQTQAPNQCNVQACASAYRSFRASDCSYQPFEGARRVCEGAPSRSAERVTPRDSEPRRDVTVRRSDRDAELDAVAQRVKEITGRRAPRRVYASDDANFDLDDDAPSRVIGIERRGGLWR